MRLASLAILLLLGSALGAPRAVRAQGAAPATPATRDTAHAAPAPPPSPVSGIRNKLSAGDLPSAESMLEVYRERNGEDGAWLTGLSWLARGALLMGDLDRARDYIAQVRARCDERLARGATLATDHDVEIAWGAAVEVEAQRLERTRGARAAAAFVRGELARTPGPVALRSRLNKRLDLLTLTGAAAPELAIEDYVGERPPTLAALRGRPVLLFVWAEGCGDCRAQEAALARATARFADHGLQVVALTRYYDEGPDRVREKARVDSVWNTAYATMGRVPIVLSTASMERYGGSSTPTFVFVDRAGIVRRYTPTRLTEAELVRSLESLVR